jgi:ribose 5-phosphate isomerase B
VKTIKDKQILVAADFAGRPLKEAVVKHLETRGWTVTDVSGRDGEMYHRVGLRTAAMVSEGEFERALLFCGTGMGIHIAASKCPHIHAAVCESVPAALRCVTANGCNVLAMGSFYVAPRLGMAMADAFLEHKLGDGYEDWPGFYEFHKLGCDELESFDYTAYKANGFALPNPGEAPLGKEPEGLAY